MIEVQLLRYVLAAAETGSFSRAADHFGIKQSTLSKRVHFLERRLGLALFRRSTRGVAPTDPGARFVQHARRIVQDVDALAAEAKALAKGEAGTLRLGFHGSLIEGDLSALIRAYCSACPDVKLEARECGRSKLLSALDRGHLDLAVFAGGAQRHELRMLSFWSDPLLIGLGADHPLIERDPLFWTDLRGSAFVVTAIDPGPDIAQMIVARLAGPGHRPSIVRQDVSPENLLSFAARDRVTACTGRPRCAGNGVTLREIHDAFGPTRLGQGLHWRDDNANPALKRFLALVATRYGRTASEMA